MSENDESNRIIITGLDSDLAVNPATGLFDGIEIDTVNKKITMPASVLGADDITLWTTGEYSEYEFSLGVDVTTYSVTTPEFWQLGNGSVHYNSGTATGGYSVVGGNRIVSLPAVTETSFSISGLPKNSPSVEQVTVDSASSEVKLATSAFGKQDSLAFNFSSADYDLALSDDVLKGDYGAAIYTQGETNFKCTLLSTAACKYSSIVGTSGNDVISLGADALNCTINGGNGYNTIYGNGGGHFYINEAGSLSSGDDTILGFSGDDVIVKPFPVFIAGESFTSIPGGSVKLKAAKKADATGDTADDFDNFASGDILKAIGIDGKLNSYAVLSAPVTLAAGGTNTVDNSYIYLDAAGGNFTNSADNIFITTSDTLNNFITNTGDHVFISVGSGADTISNSGDNVVIFGGGGNDSIVNSGEFVSIAGGGGANTISTSKGNVTLYGGTADDAVAISTATDKPVVFQVASGTKSKKITGFKEGDFIYYNGTSSPFTGTVKGSTDGSYITFGTNDNSTIYAATGYNFDINHGCTFLLRGDKPSDENLTVVYPQQLHFNEGGIYNLNGVAKAQEYWFQGDAETTINNAMSNCTIVGQNQAGSHVINNTGSNMLLYAGGGTNNSITSSGDACTIYGGAGNDTINLVNANANTVLAGAGEDVISISGTSSNNSIYGGAGADSIISNGNHNIFWYAGNSPESTMTGSENISDSIKGFNTDNDKIFVRNMATTLTSATVEAGAQLTLTNGTKTTNILLEGKGSNDTIKILWASATDERSYAIGSTADNSSGWAT